MSEPQLSVFTHQVLVEQPSTIRKKTAIAAEADKTQKENFYIAFENLKWKRFYLTEMLIRFAVAKRSQSLAVFSIK